MYAHAESDVTLRLSGSRFSSGAEMIGTLSLQGFQSDETVQAVAAANAFDDVAAPTRADMLAEEDLAQPKTRLLV
jgi:hypothetical protein